MCLLMFLYLHQLHKLRRNYYNKTPKTGAFGEAFGFFLSFLLLSEKKSFEMVTSLHYPIEYHPSILPSLGAILGRNALVKLHFTVNTCDFWKNMKRKSPVTALCLCVTEYMAFWLFSENPQAGLGMQFSSRELEYHVKGLGLSHLHYESPEETNLSFLSFRAD